MKSNQSVFILGFHLLFLLVLLLWSMHAPIGDWGNYYYGSKAYLRGSGIDIYDPTHFNAYVASCGEQHFFLSYTQVPPLSLLIYIPFSLLKAGTAKLLFSVLTYLICVFSITRLFRKRQLDLRWSLLLPLLFFLPFKSNIDLGQSYFLLIAMLVEGWMARENGKWILSAILFALSIHLKLFPAIILIWFLMEKDWKMFGATICAVGLFFVISLMFVNWEIWKFYFVEILPRMAKGEITNTYSTSYQSMQVLLKQLFVPDALQNKNYVLDEPFFYEKGNRLWLGIVLVIATLFSYDKKRNSFFRFSIWIFAGLLISGYGSSYGLLQLVFLTIAIISSSRTSTARKIILLILIGIVANIPVQWFLNYQAPFSFPRLFFILILLGTIIYFFRPEWNRVAMILSVIILISLFTINNLRVDENNYLLKEEPSLLITDFAVEGNTIKYNFRNQDGMNTASIVYHDSISDFRVLKYDPHCIHFDGGDIEFPGERIARAFLINGNTLLYLSDKNRGVGFYTIREMRIR
ncbi:MAG TPA: glycosyltransferase family 87 protein [Bacteroidia bacterium]|nr:glycosyltransferase family 87 protein [Bacteroidia bacterium]